LEKTRFLASLAFLALLLREQTPGRPGSNFGIGAEVGIRLFSLLSLFSQEGSDF
jgi:hypothetical protein